MMHNLEDYLVDNSWGWWTKSAVMVFHCVQGACYHGIAMVNDQVTMTYDNTEEEALNKAKAAAFDMMMEAQSTTKKGETKE